jgi:3-methyladenine DNA glycosylase/8-oxoguanine DNA glycosylase
VNPPRPGGRVLKLARSGEFEIDPVPPFSFPLTARNPAGWDLFTSDEVYEEGILWTGVRFDGKPIGLKIESLGTLEEPGLRVGVYTEKALTMQSKGRLQSIVSESLGAEQDLREFYDLARRDPILKHVVESLYGLHDAQTASLFNSVILSICLQMARLKRSNEMMDAINRKYGETIEFDGRRVLLQPTAEKIAKLDPAVFAKECKLGYRAKYLVASAKMIAEGFPSIQEILRMPPDEAKEKLMLLPGIGDYAADIINPHGGFPIDAWSVDVFGLLFFGKEPENRRDAIEKVKQEGIKRWGVWSWMAFFYIAQDLRNLSKRLGIELRLE